MKQKSVDSGLEIPAETARIMEQMLRMPPKHHEDMKVGGRRAKSSTKQAKAAPSKKPSNAKGR
jgi:hypothetical protein